MRTTTRIDSQEFVEKGAIVDHRLTHLFSAGLSALPSQRERASGAVILDDHRMVDRQVVRTSIELFEGIPTRSHHLSDELVRVTHCTVGVVHKAPLNETPLTDERIGLILGELAQAETADALGPLPQKSVSACGADSLDGSFVLRSKAVAQIGAPAPVRVRPGHKHEHQDDGAHTDEHEGF